MKARLALILILAAVGPAQAAFPGSNGRIAYTVYSGRDDERVRVLTIEPDGSDARNLGQGLQPAWSPDGRLLAFTGAAGTIWTMDAKGNGRRQIAPYGATPSWSPDGRRIVYTAELDGNWDLYVVELATGSRVRLTNGPEDDLSPAWSPDGGLIAYTYAGELWTITPEGAGARRLAPRGYEASWSPDGRTIVFNDDRGWLLTVPRTGGKARRIRPGSDPTFSPDGHRLVFLGPHGLCISEADGSEARSLALNGVQPDWQPGHSSRVGAPPYTCGFRRSRLATTVKVSARSVAVGATVGFTVRIASRGPDPAFFTFRLLLPDGGKLLLAGKRRTIGPCTVDPGYFRRYQTFCDPKRPLFPGRHIQVKLPVRAEEPGPLRLGISINDKRTPAVASTVVRGCTVVGTPARDILHGTPGPDVICGGEGTDRISGLGGADVAYGGAGADQIDGGDGNDILNGDFGNDWLVGGPGEDDVFMGHGDDVAFAGPGADLVSSGESWGEKELADEIGEQDRDRIHGGPGADTLEGGPKRDFYYAEHGDDLLLARDGTSDRVFCGRGRDRAYSDAQDTTRNCEFVQPRA